MTTKEILQESQKAKLFLALTDTEVKNNALQSMAQALVENTASILEANTIDMEAARQHISEVMLDRLMLNEERLQSMGRGILDVVKLEDHSYIIHLYLTITPPCPHGYILQQVQQGYHYHQENIPHRIQGHFH